METYHKKSGEKLKEYLEYIGIPSQLSTLSFSVSFWKILPYTHRPHRVEKLKSTKKYITQSCITRTAGQSWLKWGDHEG